MPSRALVLDLVSLTPALLARPDLAPTLSALAEEGRVANVRPPFPAVTCTAQATLTTGALPREHGVVANGWFDRERHAVEFWEQPAALAQAPRAWERLRERRPGATAAQLFFQQSLYGTADYVLSPRPIHLEGQMVPWVYSRPAGLYEGLVPDVGEFNLMDYWGPLASRKSTDWIARAAARVLSEKRPTLSYVYFPHLDYNHLRHGPSSEEALRDVTVLDETVGAFLDDLDSRGALDDCAVALVGEYAFQDVTRPVFPNRALREAGLLAVREIKGHEYLDTENSRAFAVVDHQVAHVYCHADALEEARDVLGHTKGVDAVLDREAQRPLGIDHPRSGDLVTVADPTAWFAYYWWRDEAKAPPFARTVDIHRKPGFDPVELFVDPRTRSIPLEAGLVRGSHGRPAEGPRDLTSLVVTGADRIGFRDGDTIDLGDVPRLLLDVIAPVREAVAR